MQTNREAHDKARSEMKAKYASSSYHAGDSSQMAKAALEHCKAIKDIGGAQAGADGMKSSPEDQAAILADVMAEVEMLEQVLAEHIAKPEGEAHPDEAPAAPAPESEKGLGQESPLNPTEAVKPEGPPTEKTGGPVITPPPQPVGAPAAPAPAGAAPAGGDAAGAGAASVGMVPGGGSNLHAQAAEEHKAMAEEHAEGSAEKAYHMKAAALHEGVAKEGESVEMTKTAPADGTTVKTAPADGTSVNSVTKEGDNIEMTKALAEANKIIKSMETRLAKVEAQPDYANAPARFLTAMNDGLEDPDQIIKGMQPRDRDTVSRSVLSDAFEGIIGKAMGKRR
jgi:hypothetical protein